MPFEAFEPTVDARVRDLNATYTHPAAIPVLRAALRDPRVGRTALVSSFGAESVVLLHMIAMIDRTLPVLFIDSEMLFPETREYQRSVSDTLGLTDVRVIKAPRNAVTTRDPDGTLHHSQPDACCALRKSEPLQRALAPFDAWITGRKAYQGGARQHLPLFENENDARVKINPLIKWRAEDVADYIIQNNLPRHPLVTRGYLSIGCAPCTSKVTTGENTRAGRWRGQVKTECGIHLPNGADT